MATAMGQKVSSGIIGGILQRFSDGTVIFRQNCFRMFRPITAGTG